MIDGKLSENKTWLSAQRTLKWEFGKVKLARIAETQARCQIVSWGSK